jgi:hypothetical protein
MGIAPDIWGPSTWTFLHLIAMSEQYEKDDSRLVFYKDLYILLQELLPCGKCRNHLKENMKSLKSIESITSPRELFDWTTQLHNLVNKLNNKREYTLEESYNLWNEIASGKKNVYTKKDIPENSLNIWKYISLLLILIFALYTVSQISSRLVR